MADPVEAFDGNRIWRVATAEGPVVQKLYHRRGRWPREELRAAITWLAGRKSSPRARERQRTERRLLQLWRDAGFDVPREVSARHPSLTGPHHLLLEDVTGRTLRQLLFRKVDTPRAVRDDLLRRFGRAWSARHDLALSLDEPAFVQEHGSFDHALVVGERLVTIDLEQTHLPAQPVFPLVAKEIADTLRSLVGRVEPDVFRDDLHTLVDAYDDDARLRAVVREYGDNPRPLRRLLWRIDRAVQRHAGRRTSKYTALAELTRVLDERAARPALSAPA